MFVFVSAHYESIRSSGKAKSVGEERKALSEGA